ncbi:response regulator, partial [Oxalobacteraceae bacterium OM1]
ALAILRDAQPGVVLLDLQLAAGSGREVLQALAARRSGTRVFVVTNHVDFLIRRHCLQEGAHGFYDKSHDLARLQEDLRQLAGLSAGIATAT